ncbi:hypothetical protein C8R43DRAFT_963395 [Mycena crocata]|nr:hypothetical protein C8R43DRAFT_963395 [Mycena crocata]
MCGSAGKQLLQEKNERKWKREREGQDKKRVRAAASSEAKRELLQDVKLSERERVQKLSERVQRKQSSEYTQAEDETRRDERTYGAPTRNTYGGRGGGAAHTGGGGGGGVQRHRFRVGVDGHRFGRGHSAGADGGRGRGGVWVWVWVWGWGWERRGLAFVISTHPRQRILVMTLTLLVVPPPPPTRSRRPPRSRRQPERPVPVRVLLHVAVPHMHMHGAQHLPAAAAAEERGPGEEGDDENDNGSASQECATMRTAPLANGSASASASAAPKGSTTPPRPRLYERRGDSECEGECEEEPMSSTVRTLHGRGANSKDAEVLRGEDGVGELHAEEELHSEEPEPEKEDAVGDGGACEQEEESEPEPEPKADEEGPGSDGEGGGEAAKNAVLAYGSSRSYCATSGRYGAKKSSESESARRAVMELGRAGADPRENWSWRWRCGGFAGVEWRKRTGRRGRRTSAAARFLSFARRCRTRDEWPWDECALLGPWRWRVCMDRLRSSGDAKLAMLKDRDGDTSGESSAAETRSPNSSSEKGGRREDDEWVGCDAYIVDDGGKEKEKEKIARERKRSAVILIFRCQLGHGFSLSRCDTCQRQEAGKKHNNGRVICWCLTRITPEAARLKEVGRDVKQEAQSNCGNHRDERAQSGPEFSFQGFAMRIQREQDSERFRENETRSDSERTGLRRRRGSKSKTFGPPYNVIRSAGKQIAVRPVTYSGPAGYDLMSSRQDVLVQSLRISTSTAPNPSISPSTRAQNSLTAFHPLAQGT